MRDNQSFSMYRLKYRKNIFGGSLLPRSGKGRDNELLINVCHNGFPSWSLRAENDIERKSRLSWMALLQLPSPLHGLVQRLQSDGEYKTKPKQMPFVVVTWNVIHMLCVSEFVSDVNKLVSLCQA